jgi:hypothetical protein
MQATPRMTRDDLEGFTPGRELLQSLSLIGLMLVSMGLFLGLGVIVLRVFS